jgi:hypothetical protein
MISHSTILCAYYTHANGQKILVNNNEFCYILLQPKQKELSTYRPISGPIVFSLIFELVLHYLNSWIFVCLNNQHSNPTLFFKNVFSLKNKS